MEVNVKRDPWIRGSLRCEVAGRDVTNDCIAANEEEGWALLYETGPDGRHFIQGGGPKTIKLFGKVVLSLAANASEEARLEYAIRRQ